MGTTAPRLSFGSKELAWVVRISPGRRPSAGKGPWSWVVWEADLRPAGE